MAETDNLERISDKFEEIKELVLELKNEMVSNEDCNNQFYSVLQTLDGLVTSINNLSNEQNKPSDEYTILQTNILEVKKELAGMNENVDEIFLQNHLVEFCGEGFAVVGGDFLDADRLADGIFGATGLADFSDSMVGIDHDFHLLFAQFVAVHRQGRNRLLRYFHDSFRVAENVAVHQQKVLIANLAHRHPKRIDVVVMLVVSVMKKVKSELWEVNREEIANLVGAIARDDDKFRDVSHRHRLDGALQQRFTPHFEQAFRLLVGQWAQAFRHSCCENYSFHGG